MSSRCSGRSDDRHHQMSHRRGDVRRGRRGPGRSAPCWVGCGGWPGGCWRACRRPGRLLAVAWLLGLFTVGCGGDGARRRPVLPPHLHRPAADAVRGARPVRVHADDPTRRRRPIRAGVDGGAVPDRRGHLQSAAVDRAAPPVRGVPAPRMVPEPDVLPGLRRPDRRRRPGSGGSGVLAVDLRDRRRRRRRHLHPVAQRRAAGGSPTSPG